MKMDSRFRGNDTNMPVTGVILAGGRSTRFGSNKAFAELHGKKLIEHVVSIMKAVFDEVIISANEIEQYEQFGCKVLKDIIPYLGPLGGIITALRYTDNDAIFVTACDMPFISAAAIDMILSHAGGYDAVVARVERGIEPLFALYRKKTVEKALESSLRACREAKFPFTSRLPLDKLGVARRVKENNSLLSILERIKNINYIDIDRNIVTNINTKDDYESASL